MSEYWVSKKKYFCTYCEIYIADDAPSRAHHENGMRHQGNKERFVKGLYKAGEKKKKEEEEERREMKNVDAAALRAYALDVGAGRAGTSSSAGLSISQAKKAPPPKKPSNPYANYTTAEFLGYKDPDAERIQAEIERKRSQGVAGDWELVPTKTGAEAQTIDDSELVPTGMKRGAEDQTIDDEDGRAWKLRKKTVRLGEMHDPEAIPVKLKVKKEEPVDADIAGNSATTTNEVASAGSASQATDLPSNGGDSGSLFKKRKGKPPPASVGRGRRDQF